MKVLVNGIGIEVEEGTTILEAAKAAGFVIPTLCHLKGLSEVGACRLCVVEVKGHDRLVSACNTVVQDGMEIETRSERVRETRLANLRLGGRGVWRQIRVRRVPAPRSGIRSSRLSAAPRGASIVCVA